MSLLSEWMLTKSSPSVSHWLPLSVSLLAETHFDDLKGRLCFFHYSNISELDIRVRPGHPPPPNMSVVALQNQRPEFTETFMLGYFYFKEFFPFFKKKKKKCISDATLCKFIRLNYSLIEIKAPSVGSASASSHYLKHSWHSISCVCVFSAFEGKMPLQHSAADIRESIKDRKTSQQ